MSVSKWEIDPVHSEIQFKVRHMLVSQVTGEFDRFQATAETDGEHFEGARVTFTAETGSVNTGAKDRDKHLRSDDFFNAEKYPKLLFKSTSFEKVDDEHYKLTGDLTIRDVTRPVTLDVEYGGIVKDPYGNRRTGFTVTGKINRKDYGLKWNALLESGGAVAGDEVKINCHVEFIQSLE